MKPENESPSRRAFFFLGALAAIGLRPARAQAQRKARLAVPQGRFRTIAQSEVPGAPPAWADKHVRLLRRATYGPSQSELTAVKAVGYQAWLQRQVKWTRIPNTDVDTLVAMRYPNLSRSADDIYAISSGTLEAELQQSTIYRAAFSKRQLYERMVEFWTDHFNIDYAKVGYLKMLDDRDVIRKHALGKFRDLLKASAHSAGDARVPRPDTQSRGGAPNQNYARELMELHTLGVDGGYTQNDVAELSRVLTGWTIAGRGEFTFDPALHDCGAKTVLGDDDPRRPAHRWARRASRKASSVHRHAPRASEHGAIHRDEDAPLAARLRSDARRRSHASPPSYTQTGGDIPSMMRAIAQRAVARDRAGEVKRPFHFLVSALRATESDGARRRPP